MQQKTSSYFTLDAAGEPGALQQNNQHAARGKAADTSHARQKLPSSHCAPGALPASPVGRRQNQPTRDGHENSPRSFATQERRERRILTPIQAAELLGCDDKTITRWARKGYLPAHPMGEGKKKKYWRFFEDELIEWLMRQRNGAFAA